MKTLIVLTLSAVCVVPAFAQGVGYSDTPQIRGQKWKVHDKERPNPPTVTPGATFNGSPASERRDLAVQRKGFLPLDPGRGAPKWKLENGYMEVVGKTGNIATKDEFGDAQVHLEFATPSKVEGESQGRGNSGVFFHGQFEVQVLDSHNNKTYADGRAGALYGQWPPSSMPSGPRVNGTPTTSFSRRRGLIPPAS